MLSVEKSLTLQANTNDQVLFESHPNDSRVTGPVEVAPTVSARYGTGGNNTPLVMGCDTYNGAITGETACTLTSASGAPNTSGPKVMVLNDQGNTPAVVYGICSKDSNSMKSSNPHSGIYEAEKSRTLDTSGANPNCNQGGNVVVESHPFTEKADCLYAAYGTKWNGNGAAYNGSLFAQTVQNKKVYALEGNGSRPSHRGDGWSESEKMYTLNTIERHAVAYGIDQKGGKGSANYTVDIAPTLLSDSHGTPHAVAQPVDEEKKVWTTSKASFMTNWTENQAQTLVATDWKDAPVIVQENKDEEDV